MPSTPKQSAAEKRSADVPTAPPSLPQPRVLTDTVTVADAARMTGKHPQTIRRWANDGTLQSTRLGHREFRIYKASLEAFIDGASAGNRAVPASGSSVERPAGGLFDPEWGLFTRQPFHDPETAS